MSYEQLGLAIFVSWCALPFVLDALFGEGDD